MVDSMDSNMETSDAAIASMPNQTYHYSMLPPRLTTKLNAIDYNMNHKRRGFCLIFDNEKFHPSRGLPRRHGSQVDSNGLYNLFRAMSFDVYHFKDMTAKEIKYQLEHFAKLDHSDMDCFACCVLTHGEHGHLWGTDARFPIDVIFNNFRGNECPTLAGKPKIFLIQACQGDRLDHGIQVYSDALDSSHTTLHSIPTHADFLMAYSTLPGFYSWRNTQDGSWFMQAIIRVFSEYHHDLDILTMLTIVNHQVAYFKQSNATTPEYNGKKQVPCITSMLTRRVFLRPKKLLP